MDEGMSSRVCELALNLTLRRAGGGGASVISVSNVSLIKVDKAEEEREEEEEGRRKYGGQGVKG